MLLRVLDMNNHKVVVQTVFSAATDEGKTLAYLLPIVTQILDHVGKK